MPREPQRTAFTMKALDLAEMFRIVLGDLRLTGRRTFRPELTSPEGLSTGGGVQAMQHLKLIPVEQAGTFAGTFVVAHANQADMTAQVRTYDHVDAQYRARFKSAVPFTREEYDAFMAQIREFLQTQNFTIMIEPYTPPAPTANADEASGGGRILLTLVILALVAGAIVLAASL